MEVTVDYKFEDMVCIHEETEEDSVSRDMKTVYPCE